IRENRGQRAIYRQIEYTQYGLEGISSQAFTDLTRTCPPDANSFNPLPAKVGYTVRATACLSLANTSTTERSTKIRSVSNPSFNSKGPLSVVFLPYPRLDLCVSIFKLFTSSS